MKRILLSMILIVILSACAGQAQPTEQPFIPIDVVKPTRTPSPAPQTELTPAEQAAIARLSSTLDLPAGQISILSTEAVNWPDGCLGIQRPGMMCTEAIVPGYKIVLEAGGEQYEFRTNESGSQVAQVSGAPLGLMEEAIAAQLASNLGLDVDEIVVVSSDDVEFPDSCLGVAMQDEMCAQAITPGKIIVLKANGLDFEYHISADGSRVQPATIALTWTRDGGIAGFCDQLTVFLSGEVYGSNCRSQQPEAAMNLLTATEQRQIFMWVKKFGQANVEESDPPMVADRMVVKLEFQGNGKSKPSDADKQALMQFAQTLYQRLGAK